MSAESKTSFKTEYAVQITCKDCVDAVKNVLSEVPGVDHFDINLEEQRVIVEGTAPPSKISKLLKNSGRKVIVRGQGTIKGSHSGAAVCIFEPYTFDNSLIQQPQKQYDPKGLARFVQIDGETCLIDITIEDFPQGNHGIHVHELGNISQGAQSTGSHYNPDNKEHGDATTGHVGDLGNIEIDERGYGDLVIESNRLKVWDLIGRSLVISLNEDDLGRGDNFQSKIDGNSGPGLIAGIIARSAGAFENKKKICTCSGETLWEEARF
ncbi:4862_t:CDS:2 [Ambispora leptoticha]|uniref:Superoxide dismutase 1 copper chaperone n=1 Tax=Ambispora leptoticha TaxID=144679 RepID=A0A9N9GSZ1_9GLOM|nr:4862_t:CDS:2 [Ambispora leptoticha]